MILLLPFRYFKKVIWEDIFTWRCSFMYDFWRVCKYPVYINIYIDQIAVWSTSNTIKSSSKIHNKKLLYLCLGWKLEFKHLDESNLIVICNYKLNSNNLYTKKNGKKYRAQSAHIHWVILGRGVNGVFLFHIYLFYFYTFTPSLSCYTFSLAPKFVTRLNFYTLSHLISYEFWLWQLNHFLLMVQNSFHTNLIDLLSLVNCGDASALIDGSL